MYWLARPASSAALSAQLRSPVACGGPAVCEPASYQTPTSGGRLCTTLELVSCPYASISLSIPGKSFGAIRNPFNPCCTFAGCYSTATSYSRSSIHSQLFGNWTNFVVHVADFPKLCAVSLPSLALTRVRTSHMNRLAWYGSPRVRRTRLETTTVSHNQDEAKPCLRASYVHERPSRSLRNPLWVSSVRRRAATVLSSPFGGTESKPQQRESLDLLCFTYEPSA
jgi:hypothetical protein